MLFDSVDRKLDIDTEAIEQNFVRGQKAKPTEELSKPTANITKLISPDRAKEIGVFMKKYKPNTTGLVNSILCNAEDNSPIGSNLLEALAYILGTRSLEAKAFAKAEEEGIVFDFPSEKFLAEVNHSET